MRAATPSSGKSGCYGGRTDKQSEREEEEYQIEPSLPKANAATTYTWPQALR